MPYFGGKYRIRDDIVKRMPPHEKYVEPFAGAGNVLLAKPPVKMEILADKNAAVINVHSTIKHRGPEFHLSPNRKKWEEIKHKSPSQRSAAEEVFLIKYSYDGTGKNYSEKKAATIDTGKIQEREKDVIMVNDDFATTMRRWDSPETLHYLDPPYGWKDKKGKWRENDVYETKGVTPERVEQVARKMKGDVIVSYDDSTRVRKAFKSGKWRKHTISNPYTAEGKIKVKRELLITNYDISKERAKAKPYDESKARKEQQLQA